MHEYLEEGNVWPGYDCPKARKSRQAAKSQGDTATFHFCEDNTGMRMLCLLSGGGLAIT